MEWIQFKDKFPEFGSVILISNGENVALVKIEASAFRDYDVELVGVTGYDYELDYDLTTWDNINHLDFYWKYIGELPKTK
jgi:hypothetical protein